MPQRNGLLTRMPALSWPSLRSSDSTVMHLVAAESAGCTELTDLSLDLMLQVFKPGAFLHRSAEPLKVGDDQCAQRGIALRCCDPGVAIDLAGNGDGNTSHRFTVSQFLRP
jgi:hypothetical protein